jgi:phosphoribosylaminoimidazole-succinocarboxamide synthase
MYKVSLFPVDGINHLIEPLCKRLNELDIITTIQSESIDAIKVSFQEFYGKRSVILSELLEHVLRHLPFDFEKLPLLVEGESKIVRQLNAKMVVERFKPTVYSFTHNRYGEVEGTAELRILFSAELFRRMNRYSQEQRKKLKNAFLAVVTTAEGPLLIQEKVETCNLEVRVKRYHVGSPVHRYKYSDKYNTVQLGEAPLKKWTRFDVPIICFDWRLPLTDEEGNRLADEPISDDYAGIWMNNVEDAKNLARETFSWMEQLFRDAGLVLVDICFFIDKSGRMIYGEISPDCMRVREAMDDLQESSSFDKDLWREGERETMISKRYHKLFHLLFNQNQSSTKSISYGKSDNPKQALEDVSGWRDHTHSSSQEGTGNESERTGKSISECF